MWTNTESLISKWGQEVIGEVRLTHICSQMRFGLLDFCACRRSTPWNFWLSLFSLDCNLGCYLNPCLPGCNSSCSNKWFLFFIKVSNLFWFTVTLSWKDSALPILCLLSMQVPSSHCSVFQETDLCRTHHLGTLSGGFLVGLCQWERLADWRAGRKRERLVYFFLYILVPGL